MALQVKLTNRRQFLGRSALGAGSLLFGPLLLESCTDHLIPPDGPIKPPIFGDDESVDWNEDAKDAVITGLQLVPTVGGFLGSLVSIFWPDSGVNTWGKVQTDLEISNEVYNIVSDTLGAKFPTPKGLISYVQTYQDDLKNSTASEILTSWNNAVSYFRGVQGLFQDSNNQVALLPLFTQFANMYLALLRDGVKYGQSWGRTDADHNNTDIPTLQNTITAYVTYANDTYKTGRDIIQKSKAADDEANEPFTSVNRYDRTMTMVVLDYMDSWQYYDVIKYPNGATTQDGKEIPLFTREIYSDPYGNTHNSNTQSTSYIDLPSPATQFPTQITVWAGSRIDAVQLTYPAGGGPGGVTQTPRMGDPNGGSANTFTVSPSRVATHALVTYDNIDGAYWGYTGDLPDQYITSLELAFVNDSPPEFYRASMGATLGKHQSPFITYNNYALSSIYIHGFSIVGNTADCIVFGFMRRPQ